MRCGRRHAMVAMRTRRAQWVRAAAGRYSGDGARWERAAARGRDGGAVWRAPWERVTVGQGPVSAGPGSGRAAECKTGERRWRRMGAGCGRAAAHFWRSGTVAVGDGYCEGGCAGKGKMKKRPHMRSLYVKAISFARLYGKLERELRLSSSRRVPQSSSWGERIRGKLQEPWCQQRCGRSYGIPKP